MICTFFGHRDTPDAIEDILRETLNGLILHKNVDCFYVGNNGNFDAMVIRLLTQLKAIYPHIEVTVVLAYTPSETPAYPITLLPDGQELVPPRFAIDRRNRWMLKVADVVVVYARYAFGGAAKYAELARRADKMVVNLANNP